MPFRCAWDLLSRVAMRGPTLPESVTYRIDQTERGWLLITENPHCSVRQLFQTSSSARQAIGRAIFALETLTAQHLEHRPEV